MKRKIRAILPLFAALFIFAACGQSMPEVTPVPAPGLTAESGQVMPSTAPEAFIEPSQEETPAEEWVAPVETADTEGLNIYWQAGNLQFAPDAEATLSLYVDASKNEEGEFGFDDGQEWLLLLETSLGYYELFPRAYVQLGDVNCTAFNDADGIFHVLVTMSQGAGYRIEDCVFDAERQQFQMLKIYEQSGINRTAYFGYGQR